MQPQSSPVDHLSGTEAFSWEHRVLDLRTVGTIRETILANRANWSQYQDSPLLSLGCPAYRFRGSRDEYREHVRPVNRFLLGSFADTYRRVLDALEVFLGERVALAYEIAHPGFHIIDFQNHENYMPDCPHTDAPFAQVPWLDINRVQVGQNLTFVVAITLPSTPCGIQIFRSTSMTLTDLNTDWDKEPYRTVLYAPGTLCLFSGSNYHRLTPVNGAPGEFRITLQGHILRLDGQLIAYW